MILSKSIDRIVARTLASTTSKNMAKTNGDSWNFSDDPDWQLVQDLNIDNEILENLFELRYNITSLLHAIKCNIDSLTDDALSSNLLMLQKRLQGITSIPNIDINYAANSSIGNAVINKSCLLFCRFKSSFL